MTSQPITLPEIRETHQQGLLSIENFEIIQQTVNRMNCDVGIQTCHDGRIWLCVNGIALIRFKPQRRPEGPSHP